MILRHEILCEPARYEDSMYKKVSYSNNIISYSKLMRLR